MARSRVSTERRVAELALQLGRAAYGESSSAELTPAQWMAVRFFARANRFSRTISAFAEFHATTRGTASQTVKSLVQRGFLSRTRSERDGRSTNFALTDRSRRLLAADPFEAVVRAVRFLSSGQRERTASGLGRILGHLAAERERPAVGVCALCGHLARERDGAFRCGLMREPLARVELDQLCVRFDDAPPRARTTARRVRK